MLLKTFPCFKVMEEPFHLQVLDNLDRITVAEFIAVAVSYSHNYLLSDNLFHHEEPKGLKHEEHKEAFSSFTKFGLTQRRNERHV